MVLALMRVSGAGIGFLTQVLLARVLGAHDLGLFYSVTSLATVAGFIMSLGYSQIAFRFAARYRDANREALFRTFVSRATLDALAAAVCTALAISALSLLWPDLDTKTRLCYALGGGMVISTTALTLYTNFAGSVRMFGWSFVPEGIVRPLLFLVSITFLWLGFDYLSAVEVALTFTILNAFFATMIIVVMLRVLPRLAWPSRSSRHVATRWRREALTLVLLSLYTNSFADIGILFATPFLSSADTALFGICLKLSLLIGYAIQVAQQLAVPDLADARQAGDVAAMRRAVRRSLPFPVLITAAALLGCALLGDRVLAIFGPHFAHGRDILIALVACQLVRAMAGPSPHLITLSGAQKVNATLCVGALVLLFAADAALATAYGPLGAAAAVFISYTAWIVATGVALSWLGEIRTDLLMMLAPPARRTQ